MRGDNVRPSVGPAISFPVSVKKPVFRIFIKFGIGVLHEKLLHKHEFHENRLSDNHAMNFYPYVFVHNGDKSLAQNSLHCNY